MLCEPTANVLVLSAAIPELMATGCPSWVDPSKKVIVPLGVVVTPRTLEPVMVAVKVTDWPAPECGEDDCSAVELPLLLSSTPTPEKDCSNPLATTSRTPSPFTSARAKSQAQRLAAKSSGV